MDELPGLEAADVTGLIAEPDRLRAFAALALGASTLEQVASTTGLDARAAGRALARLEAGGLASRDGATYKLETAVLQRAARESAQKPQADDYPHVSREESKVLRSFFQSDRLLSIPAQLSKRVIVLDRIAQAFEPGVRYTESEVNDILNRFHADHAALRRHLVDEEYLTREGGVYWRTGGTWQPDM